MHDRGHLRAERGYMGFVRGPRAIVQDVRNSILFSAASSWEIAIKYRPGKLPLAAHDQFSAYDVAVIAA